MKQLINYLTFILLIFFTTEVAAQTTFGLKAGVGFAKLTSPSAAFDENQLKPSFHGGFLLDFKISDYFSIESGVQMSNKGSLYKSSTLNIEYKEALDLYYVDVPVLFKAGYTTGNTKFYAALGPYLGVGVLGKVSTTTTVLGVENKDNFNIEWEDASLNRLDGGAEFRLGVELSVIQLSLYYQLGLTNLSEFTEGKNRGFGISAAVLFGNNN